jgi:hypothetical protein
MAQGTFFSVSPEYYAQLTLDQLIASLVSPAPAGNSNLLPPPMPQPMLDLSTTATLNNTTTVSALLKAAQTSKGSKPWLQWFWAVYRFITAGGSPTSQLIEVLAPSIDETDDDWWGTVGAVSSTTDPVTVTVTLAGVTRFGILLAITDAGSGYSGTVTVSIASSNGQGHPATGTAVIASGKIIGWTQTTQGYNLAEPLVVTFGSGSAAATATLGRQFAVGDFVIFNDPAVVSNAYSYEIAQITSITAIGATSFTAVLTRASASAPTGGAQYGSLKCAHASGTAIYRLLNKSWLLSLDTAAGPQPVNFLWANMCVAAVTVQQQGQSSGAVTVNLAPSPLATPRLTPPAPGMRTMNGAAYTNLGVIGNLSLSATSQARIPVQAWESIRTVYALVRTAPVGATSFNGDANAAVVIYVCYISTDGLVGLIDTLVIDTGMFASYTPYGSTPPPTNPPDGRQMPYHAAWNSVAPNFDWPPNLLPEITGALNSSGNLQLGGTVSTTATVEFAPDGTIDFIVGQVGTSVAGANLTVVVQT